MKCNPNKSGTGYSVHYSAGVENKIVHNILASGRHNLQAVGSGRSGAGHKPDTGSSMHQHVTRFIHVRNRGFKPNYEPETGASDLHVQPAAQGEVPQFALMVFGSYPRERRWQYL